MNNEEKFLLRQGIASILDYPSLYMGGPSYQSKQKAIKIIRMITDEYDLVPKKDLTNDIEIVKSWRADVPWDQLDNERKEDATSTQVKTQKRAQKSGFRKKKGEKTKKEE